MEQPRLESRRSRPAHVGDVHTLAMAMPHVTRVHGPAGNPVCQVGGRSFVFFRNPRPDAAGPGSPFFTTAHFDGHPPVPVRAARLGELSHAELAEIAQDAWLASLPPVALTSLIYFQVITPGFGLSVVLAAALLAIDCVACFIVARLFDRERLVTGTKPGALTERAGS